MLTLTHMTLRGRFITKQQFNIYTLSLKPLTRTNVLLLCDLCKYDVKAWGLFVHSTKG